MKLIGFCCEEEQRVLIYEYMSRGSLDNQLFRSKYVVYFFCSWFIFTKFTCMFFNYRNSRVNVFKLSTGGHSVAMSWEIRMKIAIGAAKGLAFLHEADSPVIYRDFKTSNILLDSVSFFPS